MEQACGLWSAHTTNGPLNVGTIFRLHRDSLLWPCRCRRHPPPHTPLVCHSTRRPPPSLEHLLLWLDDPQLPPVVYRQLEAILLLIIRLSGHLLPEHLLGCRVEVGGYTNTDGNNRGSEWWAAWLQLIALFLCSCVVSVCQESTVFCRQYFVVQVIGEIWDHIFSLPLSKTIPWE